MRIIIEWNENAQKWLMKLPHSKAFIYDFWDCGNMRKAFPGLNKNVPQEFEIAITHIAMKEG